MSNAAGTINAAALGAYIARQAGAQRATVTRSERLSGGAIQENWLVEASVEGGPHAGALALVLRTDSPSGVGASHSRAQEFALLRLAFEHGVTVPEPLWSCSDPSVIGRPFCLMRRIAGSAAGHLLVRAREGGDALAQRLGTELARIHAIRPPQAALDFLAPPAASPAMALVARARAYLDTQAVPRPALEWGLRWLERHQPATPAPVLCHRDFRTGNYMVENGRLTGILDWEFAGWSDPLEDIGWFCARCWRFGANDRQAGGIGAREAFYRGYETQSGRAIARGQVHYWEVMAHLNWAIIALQQAERHLSGTEPSLMLALTGHIVPELELEIMTMTQEE